MIRLRRSRRRELSPLVPALLMGAVVLYLSRYLLRDFVRYVRMSRM
jgi:hypothetical protein